MLRRRGKLPGNGVNRRHKLCGIYPCTVAVPLRARGKVRRQLMIFKTSVVCGVLVAVTLVLTEIHRYQVYKADIEMEEEHVVR